MANSNSYSLLLGGASDLGKAFAMRLAQEGYNLVLVDAEVTKLFQVEAEIKNLYPAIGILVIPKDFTLPSAAQELYDELKDDGIAIHTLVNQTMLGEYGMFAETNFPTEEALITANVTNIVHVTKLFLRDMLARDHGKILHVVSTSSFIPAPGQVIYGATQSFLLFFAEGIQHELKDSAVTLTIFSQGESDPNARTTIKQEGEVVDLTTVADTGYEALLQGKRHAIAGFENEQFGINKLIPESWAAALLNSRLPNQGEK